MRRKTYHLTVIDRLAVRLLLLDGCSQRQIAFRLSISLSSMAASPAAYPSWTPLAPWSERPWLRAWPKTPTY